MKSLKFPKLCIPKEDEWDILLDILFFNVGVLCFNSVISCQILTKFGWI